MCPEKTRHLAPVSVMLFEKKKEVLVRKIWKYFLVQETLVSKNLVKVKMALSSLSETALPVTE